MGLGFWKGSADWFIHIHVVTNEAAGAGGSTSTMASSPIYLGADWLLSIHAASHVPGSLHMAEASNCMVVSRWLYSSMIAASKRQDLKSAGPVKGAATFYWSRQSQGQSRFRR